MNNKRITVTIEFRGVAIKDMTPQELRELRDIIDELVGEKVKVVEREVLYPRPWYVSPYITYGSGTWSVSSGSTLHLENANNSTVTTKTNRVTLGDGPADAHYTISLN